MSPSIISPEGVIPNIGFKGSNVFYNPIISITVYNHTRSFLKSMHGARTV